MSKEKASINFELVCSHKGRVEIISGSEARSAEALPDNTFIIEREDDHRYFGRLIPKYGFIYEPGLSGERFEPKFIGKPTGIEYAILKSNIKEEKDSFWASWTKVYSLDSCSTEDTFYNEKDEQDFLLRSHEQRK